MSDRNVRTMGRAGRLLWVTGIVLTVGGVCLSAFQQALTPEVVGALCAGIPAITVGLWQDRKYRQARTNGTTDRPGD